jgi:hypothetical protein
VRCTPLLQVVSAALILAPSAHAQPDTTTSRRFEPLADTTLARSPERPDSSLFRADTSLGRPDTAFSRADTAFGRALDRADSALVPDAPSTDAPAGATLPRVSVPVTMADTSLAPRFRNRADSLAWSGARELADASTGFRVIVSTYERHLWVLDGPDTLLSAPVAVGVDTTISYGSRTWRFNTPYGRRSVLRKEANPVWVPPDWHYVEVAARRDLKLTYLSRTSAYPLRGGAKLVVRNAEVGLLRAGGRFEALPHDEEVVFDGKLFVPPLGTKNRRIPGELGKFRLDLGNGYLLHGTPYENTIGAAATHGCIRLREDDITWLYDHVPVGTRVYIY